MAKYIRPPALYDGQILSKATLSLYADNDQYFSAIADRWRMIPPAGQRGYIGNETQQTVWDGYHLLTEDAKILQVYIGAQCYPSTGNAAATWLYYDGDPVVGVEARQSHAGQWKYLKTTVDLSAKEPGLYSVRAIVLREDNWVGAQGMCACPGTYYTGSSTYTIPPTIQDGDTGQAQHFNTWRANDIHFDTIKPPQAAHSSLYTGYFANQGSRTIWRGYDKYHPDHRRVQYSVYADIAGNNPANNRVRIWYGSEYTELTEEGWNTGYWDLSGSYTKGELYEVRVELVRDDAQSGMAAWPQYICMSAASQDQDYSAIPEFTPEQYVYGDTAGQDTRLALLSTNDVSIHDRLTWGDAGGKWTKMHWAVPMPYFPNLGYEDTGRLSLIRRYDFLYYRTEDATLYWGTDGQDTYSLEDYDDDNPYRILDLNKLDLPLGTVYEVRGDAHGLMFAMEMDSG